MDTFRDCSLTHILDRKPARANMYTEKMQVLLDLPENVPIRLADTKKKMNATGVTICAIFVLYALPSS